MISITKTPLQKFLLFLTIAVSVLLQYPQPELDLGYYTSLASDHVNGNNFDDISSAFPLRGVKIVITGATSGLGLDLTKMLYNLGGTMIVIGRSKSKLSTMIDQLKSQDISDDNRGDGKHSDSKRIVPILADLQDLDDVSSAAAQIKSKFKSIDYLINNAGLTNGASTEMPTPHGHDMVFGVNYLSHFLLTEKLLPMLKKSKLKNGARVVQIASTAHFFVDGEDLIPSASSSSPWASQHSNGSILHRTRAYANSKLAQIYHTRSLARDLRKSQSNVNIVAICPTWVATHIGGEMMKFFLDIFAFRSDGFGLAPILFAMFHPDVGKKAAQGTINGDDSGKELYNDFVTNINILEGNWLALNEFIISMMPIPYLREVYCGTLGGVFIMAVQKLFANVNFRPTTSEGYDVEKQDALYKWSKETIAQWL